MCVLQLLEVLNQWRPILCTVYMVLFYLILLLFVKLLWHVNFPTEGPIKSYLKFSTFRLYSQNCIFLLKGIMTSLLKLYFTVFLSFSWHWLFSIQWSAVLASWTHFVLEPGGHAHRHRWGHRWAWRGAGQASRSPAFPPFDGSPKVQFFLLSDLNFPWNRGASESQCNQP